MEKNRYLFEMVSLILANMILVGCGAKPTAAPAQALVKVQYCSNGWFAERINARQAMGDKFNQEHKGKIEVEYIQGNWDDAEQYIQNGDAAGRGSACLMEWYDAGAIAW